MARWKLSVEHYLHTDPPSEWEHKETDQSSGRQMRKVYPVPTWLDKETIVSDGNNPKPGDIVFVGEPTPDMQPIDDEAEAISRKIEATGKWKHPIESLPAQGASTFQPDFSVPPPQPQQRVRPNIRR